MKQVATRAIILKRVNFAEADRIVTVLTEDRGIVSMLAKGVRRPKSKLAGGLELFSVIALSYIDGRSDVKTIISTRLENYFESIVKQPEATVVAYECMKLIYSYASLSQDRFYFEVLEQCLTGLNDGIHPKAVYVWFVMRLLEEAGTIMNLEKPLNAERFSEDGSYHFSFEDMAFYQDSAGQFAPKHIKYLKVVHALRLLKRMTMIADYDTLADPLQQLFQQVTRLNKA